MSDTFDLMAFVNGSSYPTATVTVYTNVAALKANADLQARIEPLDENFLPIESQMLKGKELEEALAEQAKIQEAIKASGLNFTLQGMPFRMAQEVANIFSDEGAKHEEIIKLIAMSITSVTDAKGAVASIPGEDQLEVLHKMFSPAEFQKLMNTAIEVSFAAAQYENDTDAGFPGGSADVA